VPPTRSGAADPSVAVDPREVPGPRNAGALLAVALDHPDPSKASRRRGPRGAEELRPGGRDPGVDHGRAFLSLEAPLSPHEPANLPDVPRLLAAARETLDAPGGRPAAATRAPRGRFLAGRGRVAR